MKNLIKFFKDRQIWKNKLNKIKKNFEEELLVLFFLI